MPRRCHWSLRTAVWHVNRRGSGRRVCHEQTQRYHRPSRAMLCTSSLLLMRAAPSHCPCGTRRATRWLRATSYALQAGPSHPCQPRRRGPRRNYMARVVTIFNTVAASPPSPLRTRVGTGPPSCSTARWSCTSATGPSRSSATSPCCSPKHPTCRSSSGTFQIRANHKRRCVLCVCVLRRQGPA